VDADSGPVDVLVDRTPFYAESGGQVGDVGGLIGPAGRARVTDTQYAIPGRLVRHRVEVLEGAIAEGDAVELAIDGPRRDAIRRNHTATHLLHAALREVLGPHVKQAGSHVGPDRLRFDFSHHEAVSAEDLRAIEAIANREVISDAPVRHYETTKDHAESIGAIAFFGDKYGDIVRVLEAGPHSTELCGGTHVHALGFIGPVKILSEGSVGSNLRRIEAVTGEAAFAHIDAIEEQVSTIASRLNVAPAELEGRVEKLLAQVKELNDEVAAARRREAMAGAEELRALARNGAVVVRRDGLAGDDLRHLVTATRDAIGRDAVVVVVGANGAKAVVAAALGPARVDAGGSAATLVAPVAKLLGGGTAKKPDFVVGGGPEVGAVDDALKMAEAQVADLLG
jgi:alanyl-tRNA synthetase